MGQTKGSVSVARRTFHSSHEIETLRDLGGKRRIFSRLPGQIFLSFLEKRNKEMKQLRSQPQRNNRLDRRRAAVAAATTLAAAAIPAARSEEEQPNIYKVNKKRTNKAPEPESFI